MEARHSCFYASSPNVMTPDNVPTSRHDDGSASSSVILGPSIVAMTTLITKFIVSVPTVHTGDKTSLSKTTVPALARSAAVHHLLTTWQVECSEVDAGDIAAPSAGLIR